MDQETLIRFLTDKVLERLEQRKKTALVCFTGGAIGFNESLNELKKLQDNHWNFQVVLTNSAERIFTKELIKNELKMEGVYAESEIDQLRPFYDKASLLIVPTLTMNSLAKTSLGIADNLFTNLTTEFILSNRPIIAARDACQPNHPFRLNNRNGQAPKPYVSMFENYMNQVQQFGVKLVEVTEIFQTVEQCQLTDKNHFSSSSNPLLSDIFHDASNKSSKKVISRTDVMEAKQNNTDLVVHANTIITPLAAEVIKDMNLKIIKVGEA